MPKFRFVDEQPRIYSELPHALGQVNPGDEKELDSPPDHRWQPIGAKAKAAAKDVPQPPKPAKAPAKAARKPQTDQPVNVPAEPGVGVSGDSPLDQPAPDPSDA